MRRILMMIGYNVTVTIILVLAISYTLYSFKYREIIRTAETGKKQVPHVSSLTLLRLGSVSAHKSSSFTSFAIEKPKRTIRIGAFGDSVTYGDEVDERSDYPSMLADTLAKISDRYEVINFGNSWYGFGQSYIMYDEVGRKFDLDYILLGPSTFFAQRDTHMNHSNGLNAGYIHSRFILNKGELERIDVPGDDFASVVANYYSFIPDWRILRFDRNDPVFISSTLPTDKLFGNPFYYTSLSETEEANAIYRKLVEKMKSDGIPIIAAYYPFFKSTGDTLAEIADEQLCVTPFDRRAHFPYAAPQWHNTRTGNALVAKYYASVLSGKPLRASLLTTNSSKPEAKVQPPFAEFSAYQKIGFHINGVEQGTFTSLRGEENDPSFARDKKIASFVILTPPDASIMDGLFLSGLPPLADGDVVQVVHRRNGKKKRLTLNSDKPVKGLNLDVVSFFRYDIEWREPIVMVSQDSVKSFVQPASGDLLELQVGGRVVLAGSFDASKRLFSLTPRGGTEIFKLRSLSDADSSQYKGIQSGSIDLLLSENDKETVVPVGTWQLSEIVVDLAENCRGFASTHALDFVKSKRGPILAISLSGDRTEILPHVDIYFDDVLVQSVDVTAEHTKVASQVQNFDLSNYPGARLLRIDFTNDQFNSVTGKDVNLYIDGIRINGREMNLTDAEYRRKDGVRAEPGNAMPWSGSLVFPFDLPFSR